MQTAFAAGPCHLSARTPPAFEASQRPTVFIVEPEPSLRAALGQTVAMAGWRPVVAANAEEFLARPRVIAAGCLLVEQDLSDMGGLDLQERIAERKEMPVVFMTGRSDIRTTVRAMKAGAFDFLVKPLREETLLRSLGLAIEVSAAGLQEAVRLHDLNQCFQELSRREREVLQLVTAGCLNKQVGFDLGISEITVKAHRGSLMRKMRAGSLAELVGMVSDLCCGFESRQAQAPHVVGRHAAQARSCA
ncbi:LuxR C-terminal-related transcriptional regulator [Variovorax sp. S2]|jgi:FixJ family two-component response regulator|uniref:response regulator transcription factor n=1 Tax=Variovorax sp. S12S4 TaxID=3029170 RepID=UPI00215CC676|nr:response regulator [Variovorax sp. S12S4]MCR8960569.1 LuxR C-terminal-related transcriptional regulator [Variovorax sp. S12S4]